MGAGHNVIPLERVFMYLRRAVPATQNVKNYQGKNVEKPHLMMIYKPVLKFACYYDRNPGDNVLCFFRSYAQKKLPLRGSWTFQIFRLLKHSFFEFDKIKKIEHFGFICHGTFMPSGIQLRVKFCMAFFLPKKELYQQTYGKNRR